MRRRTYRWYDRLRELEAAAETATSESERYYILDQIDRLAAQVNEIHLPAAFRDDFYRLRVHIDFIASKLRSAWSMPVRS